MGKMYEFFENNKKPDETVDGDDEEDGHGGAEECDDENTSDGGGINMNNFPSAENLHEHINGMLGGKLGELAMEIAEETASDLNLGADGDINSGSNVKDVFQKLMKNPAKLMSLVKNVGSKLDDKIKSGSIKESELISEASDIINKMKDMPGMGNIQSMLNKMGMGNLGGKVNTSAMESQLNSRMKMAKMKERMKAKSEAKAANANANASTATASTAYTGPTISEEEIIKIFSTGEKVDRTPRGTKPSQGNGDKKKKKGKK